MSGLHKIVLGHLTTDAPTVFQYYFMQTFHRWSGQGPCGSALIRFQVGHLPIGHSSDFGPKCSSEPFALRGCQQFSGSSLLFMRVSSFLQVVCLCLTAGGPPRVSQEKLAL